MTTRVCRTCGESKSLPEFKRDKRGTLGYCHQCKACGRAEWALLKDKYNAARRQITLARYVKT